MLVADDQQVVCTGLRMIVDAQEDLDLVGEAIDGIEATRAVSSFHRRRRGWRS